MTEQHRQSLFGALPDAPKHSFIGRSSELSVLENLLKQHPYAVIRGRSGIGKTTLAVELAHRLVHSGHFDRCIFVRVEEYTRARTVLDVLGRQLVGKAYSVAKYGGDPDKALSPLLHELEGFRTLIVVDNLEALSGPDNKDNLERIFYILQKLGNVHEITSQSNQLSTDGAAV